MTTCHFFYDQNTFVCVKNNKETFKTYKDEDAVSMLELIGRKEFRNIKLTKNTITFSNGIYEVYLDNIDRLKRDNLLNYFGDNLSKIEIAIQKKQKGRHTNKRITTKKGVFLATSSLIITLALAGAFSNKKNENNNTVSINIEKINDVDNDEMYEDHSVTFTPILNNTDEYDLLLNELDNEISTANIQYERIDEEKQAYAYNEYNDLVCKFAYKWGLSPNIPMSILTQESGGKETNLMQIQFDSWIDMPITSYNYDNGTYETIVLTDTPSKYSNKGYKTITRNELKNSYTNISIGTLIAKYSIEHMNYHIAAGIQAYNFGINNMNKVLAVTEQNTGISIDEQLSDQSITEFTNYTDVINVGDKNYLSNVTRYTKDDEFYINEILDNGDIFEHSVRMNISKAK